MKRLVKINNTNSFVEARESIFIINVTAKFAQFDIFRDNSKFLMLALTVYIDCIA